MCRGNLFLSHTNTHSVVESAKSAISKEKKNVRLCALCVRCGNNVMIVGEKSFVWGISFFFFLMNNRLSGDLASFMVCWSLFRREGREIKNFSTAQPENPSHRKKKHISTNQLASFSFGFLHDPTPHSFGATTFTRAHKQQTTKKTHTL